MKEDFLQYIWENSLFKSDNLISSEGESIIIHDIGVRNKNAGPDFLNAEITINEIKWFGNVEIHIKSSLWNAHSHSNDPAYNNVILHVVLEDNCRVKTFENRVIPTLEMRDLLFKEIENNYLNFINKEDFPICNSQIKEVDSSVISCQLDKVLQERLLYKSEIIEKLLVDTKQDWESVLYVLILKSFGLKVNSLPMEILSRLLPYSVIRKHKNNVFQLESLFFGVAGFLKSPNDVYSDTLKKEFTYLKHKYNLEEMDVSSWKFLRLRPANFPTIRLAQLSVLFSNSESLFSKFRNSNSVKEIIKIFNVEVSVYWDSHYVLGKSSVLKPKRLGLSTVNVIIINSIVPLFYLYGKIHSEYSSLSIDILKELKSEKNTIVSKFKQFPIKLNTAAKSQSVIHLYNNYCSQKKCLNCDIGIHLLKH